MERFDIIIVGSGSGMLIASAAVEQGFKVALIENGKMGGTCINVGCVPSKMLIYPADLLVAIKDADKLGVQATVNAVDFNNIMTRMRTLVNHDSGHQANAVEATPNLTWFKETGEFISDYTLQVGEHTISAEKIFIVSGARTALPLIKGIENMGYLTSDTVLQLPTQPKASLSWGEATSAWSTGTSSQASVPKPPLSKDQIASCPRRNLKSQSYSKLNRKNTWTYTWVTEP